MSHLPHRSYLVAQPDDLSDIDIWMSKSIIYFQIQVTEKYSSAMCYIKIFTFGVDSKHTLTNLHYYSVTTIALYCYVHGG